MTDDMHPRPAAQVDAHARTALRVAAQCWFVVTAIGMWLFVAYVAAYYGPLLLAGGPPALGETHLPNGYVAGDAIGNAAMIAHLLLAVLIIGGGPLQLIPSVRTRDPRVHRINGRVYVVLGIVTSLAGLYMVWTRGTVGGLALRLGITLDGLLILAFAVETIRHARKRDMGPHRRWALRLFMVMSGVWFYRVGFMGWMMITGGVGVDTATFSGPFLEVWAFAQYLLPLAVLEIYLRAKGSFGTRGRYAVAFTVVALTLAEAVGIFAATTRMWLPRL